MSGSSAVGLSPSGLSINIKVDISDEIGKLIDQAHRGNVKAIYKAAGLIRTIARRSIKPAPKNRRFRAQGRDARGRFMKAQEYREPRGASKPGEPPRARLRPSPLKTMMKFDVDKDRVTAIVGPALFPAAKGDDVPHVLEFGGTATNLRGERYPLKKRPYMAPSEKVSRSKYPQFWQDSI